MALIFGFTKGLRAIPSTPPCSIVAQPMDYGTVRRKLAEVASTEATKRELQFGGAFGGALLTSGSFTMMAASGGF